MCRIAPPAKLATLPRVSMPLRTPASRDGFACRRGGAGAGGLAGRVTVATGLLAQHVVGVEEGENRWCVEVFDDLDAHETGHHRLVHGTGDALRTSLGGDALVTAHGGDDHAEDDALQLAAVEFLQRALRVEGADEGAAVDADQRHRCEVAREAREDDHRDVVDRKSTRLNSSHANISYA